jgi:hypothetical protein
MAIDITSSVRTVPSVMMRPIDDGGVLVDVDRGTCWELNLTGRWIWEQVISTAPLVEIGKNLSQRYGISIEAARHDLLRLIEELARAGLVVVVRSDDAHPR